MDGIGARNCTGRIYIVLLVVGNRMGVCDVDLLCVFKFMSW
jgi:hypothetical protein